MSEIKQGLVRKSFEVFESVDKKQQESSGIFAFLSIIYWIPYFNFTTAEIAQRLKSSITHSPPFYELIGGRPDLYSTYWIYTTIIFLIGVASNISNIISNRQAQFNYEFIPTAMSLVYGIGLAGPILIWGMIKFYAIQVRLFEIICLYAYSMSCFIIITPFCIIQNDKLQLLMLFYGMGNSTYFLVKNIQQINELNEFQRYTIYGLLGGLQAIYILMYQYYFFK